MQAISFSQQEQRRIRLSLDVFLHQVNTLAQAQGVLLTRLPGSCMASASEAQHLEAAEAAACLSHNLSWYELECLTLTAVFFGDILRSSTSSRLSVYSWPYCPDVLAVMTELAQDLQPRIELQPDGTEASCTFHP
jgi:hypothetical protein